MSATKRTFSRRRSRDAGLGALLVERDQELGVMDRRLAEARGGAGGVLVVEAPAGLGKSRLLTVAADMAREADMQVLGAHASELEQAFPFGVALQLFEPRWMAAGVAERNRPMKGVAPSAARLLMGQLPHAPPSRPDESYAVIHGLYRMVCSMVWASGPDQASDPMVMLVDDVHWADSASLRFLAYLADRLADVPILLVVASREDEVTVDPEAFTALCGAADDAPLGPLPLSGHGVAAVVRSEFPDPDPAFCDVCAQTTNGNPRLLAELLAHLHAKRLPPSLATASRVAELAPEPVLTALVDRLQAMPAPAEALATAVAVLGDGATLRQVACLADLDHRAATKALGSLETAQFVQPGEPLEFTHPVITSAIKASLSALELGQAHRRAARVLIEQRAPDEQIAVQLLDAPPESDPPAVEALRAAARKALASGKTERAIEILERALAEEPSPEAYPGVLAELGQAESLAGLPQALERLEQATSATRETGRRAELALAKGRVLLGRHRYREAAAAVSSASRQLDDPDAPIADNLEAVFIAAASFVPELEDHARSRGRRLLARVPARPSDSQRAALAHVAAHESLRGTARASTVRIAQRAWGDGALLRGESPDDPAWPSLTSALFFVDELERNLEICDAALDAAHPADLPRIRATVSYCRARPLYEQGRIHEALSDAHAAIDAQLGGWSTHVFTAYAAIAGCHLQQGDLEKAEAALSLIAHSAVRNSLNLPALLNVRAELRLAQLRPDEALRDALEAGRRLESEFGVTNPGVVSWRSTAGLASLALGDPGAAHDLASEELEQARRFDITRVIIRDLRVLGLTERGKLGLDLLAEAARAGAGCEPRLEYFHALTEYGAALRRGNQRTAAREPLRKALELSHRGGALALNARVRTELAATGARPRRTMLTGVSALTPSQRRVADLAAQGLTTRRIAEALFITPKTVEFHLRHVYQKLDVNSRDELTGRLSRA